MTTFEIAHEWMKYYGYTMHMHSGDYTWLSGGKVIDYLDAHVSVELEIHIRDNKLTFSMHHITKQGLKLSRENFSGLENKDRFLKLQEIFFETVEALYTQKQLG